MKKIPKNAEVCNLMVGEIEDLQEPLFACIRLKEARFLEGLTEVKLPTRYINNEIIVTEVGYHFRHQYVGLLI